MPLTLDTFEPVEPIKERRKGVTADFVRALERKAYERGVKDGAAASALEFEQMQNRLSSRMIEVLEDNRLTYQEAKTQAVSALAGAYSTLILQHIPKLQEAGLLAQARTLLTDALKSGGDPVPKVICAPEMADRLRTALEDFAGRFVIEENPTMTPMELTVLWDDGYDRIDMTALSRTLLDLLGLDSTEMTADTAEKDMTHDVG